MGQFAAMFPMFAGSATAGAALGAELGAGLVGATSPLVTAPGIAGAFGPQISQAASMTGLLTNHATPMFTLGEGLTGGAAGFGMPALGDASLAGLATGAAPMDWQKWAQMAQLAGQMGGGNDQQMPPAGGAPPVGRMGGGDGGSFMDLLKRKSFGPRF